MPGIRPKGAAVGDHVRVMGLAEALAPAEFAACFRGLSR